MAAVAPPPDIWTRRHPLLPPPLRRPPRSRSPHPPPNPATPCSAAPSPNPNIPPLPSPCPLLRRRSRRRSPSPPASARSARPRRPRTRCISTARGAAEPGVPYGAADATTRRPRRYAAGRRAPAAHVRAAPAGRLHAAAWTCCPPSRFLVNHYFLLALNIWSYIWFLSLAMVDQAPLRLYQVCRIQTHDLNRSLAFCRAKGMEVQRRSSVLTLGSLFHDHLFSLLIIFTGIFLVNYILLSSAADESRAIMVLNFQDAKELMHQICTNPAALIVLLVILLFSSHIISLTCIVSSDVISENFFGIKLPLSAHHLLPKGFAMILTIYCAKVAGPGGVYQSLIMCPVIQARVLPSSVIPILRVSSSRLWMGRYRVSLCVEISTFLAFLLALFTNIIFAAEILFGDSTWTNNLKGETESAVILPYRVVK